MVATVPPAETRPLLPRIRTLLADGDGTAALIELGTVIEGPDGGLVDRMESLCIGLEADPETAEAIGATIRRATTDRVVGPALTESGVPSPEGFTMEFLSRIGRRLLPEVADPKDLRTLIRRIFHRPGDENRVRAVPTELWIRLIDAVGITAESVKGVDPELDTAIRMVAHHAGSLGLQPVITERLPHLVRPDSPFLSLTDRVLHYIRSYEDQIEGDEAPLLEEALENIDRCRAEVERLRATKSEHGTSLTLTGLSFRLLRLLDRLEVLLHLTEPVERDFQRCAAELMVELVVAERTRDHLLPHLRERADLLAYQVVEHAARKGAKYITSGRKDYSKFFKASLGGGILVGIFSSFKTGMYGWTIAPAAEAFIYGVNYSICFVLIYLTGSALATKQPALTANTIAQAFGDPMSRDLERLGELVVRVWRSQFVSFVGNLAMAIPVGFLVAAIWGWLLAAPIADEAKAVSMLRAIDPFSSGSIFFAAIAGVYLYLTGLFSGWVDNRNLYAHVPDRIATHPLLIRLLGGAKTQQISSFVDRNLGIIAGNIFFGFCLGSTGTVGQILGLPLDIRHIAFASAQFGTALEVLRGDVTFALLWPAALGIVVIGLVNFLVSFGLSFATALESRRITFRELRIVFVHLAQSFARRPVEWFFPPPDKARAKAG